MPLIKKQTQKRTPLIENCKLRDSETQRAFELEVSKGLGSSNPETLTTDDLSSKIRTIPVEAAKTVLPVKPKPKFPSEFSAETVKLINKNTRGRACRKLAVESQDQCTTHSTPWLRPNQPQPSLWCT